MTCLIAPYTFPYLHLEWIQRMMNTSGEEAMFALNILYPYTWDAEDRDVPRDCYYKIWFYIMERKEKRG